MIVNGLNAPVRTFMADFEDSCAPTWENLIHGQINLADAIRRRISYTDPASGKIYRLNEQTATLIVRPRGWHLPEKHVQVDGQTVSGALFDFALYLANNHEALAATAPARTSICPSSRATWKRACGTTSSTRRRSSSACRAAPSRPRC